ncbi:MAG: archease [Candidatus Micrarchaeota archaeon]|nr:archease [Candidatus Micrarchaeota archaeon]MCX8154721.1 archease [Candidatus Micrarchaeota archaeon]
MLRIEDHTADIKIIVEGEFCEIVEDLISYITQTYQTQNSDRYVAIEIQESLPELFFVELINRIIGELEGMNGVPVGYKMLECEYLKCKFHLFYRHGVWENRIKAATFWKLKYKNGRLEIVLDV